VDSTDGGPARATAVAALVLATLLAAMAGIAIIEDSEITAVWWPASGVALLALLVAPERWWPRVYPALFVAFAGANLAMGFDLVPSLGFGMADVAETVVVSQLLVRMVGRTLHQVQHTWWLLLIAVEGAFVAALGVGTVSAALLGGDFWRTVAITTSAHTASLMVITPLLMAPPGVQRFSRLQLLAQSLCIVTVVLLSFGEQSRINLGFALYPLTIWAAVSFGARVLAVQQCLLAIGLALVTAGGIGVLERRAQALPFDLGSQIMQLYLVTLVITGLPLALAMRQRIEAVEIVAARERSFQENFLSTAVPTALLTFDGDRLVFDEVNRPARTLLQRGAKELRGVDVDDVLTGPLSLVVEAHDLAEGHEASWSGGRELASEPVRHIEVSLALIGKSEGVHRLSMTLHDATEERETQRRLAEQQELNRAITDSSPNPLIVLDSNGVILVANPAATHVSGYPQDQLVGRTLWDVLLPEKRRPDVASFFAGNGAPPERGESLIITADGRRRQVIFSISALADRGVGGARWILSASDVTEERRVALLMSHLLASATTVAFISTDVDGRIILFNRGAAHMLGLEPEHAYGREFVDFLRPDDLRRRARASQRPAGFGAVVGAVAKGGDPETHDWAWVSTSGATIQVSVTISRMADDLGTTLGYFFVARDVSDTRRSQEILVKALDRERQAVAKLQALDSVRDEFISTVSHELRTPMTSIIGSAEMLADGLVGPIEEEQRALIEVIERNGERLLALANDLLALAQNDVPGWAESMVRIDLRNIVVESQESVMSLRNGRSLEVTSVLGDRAAEVYGDVQKLERAVTNLLSNAIKFTPDGGTVSATIEQHAEAGVVRLVVADTGLGIPEGERDRVFERFFRSSTVQRMAIQGTGLGLPIVKDIVESHHGTISVESEAGRGTRFTIELPLADALDKAPAAPTLSARRG
jgi:PAS domain S-box-containing protein